ncbi:MAG TPA: hypothetical protein PLB25_16910 [Rhodoferax sp.]|nr:hypothetical protein [Rhodoferax sp.]
MPSNNHYRTAASAAKFAGRIAEHSAINLARFATTDHTGSSKFLANLPSLGFVDTFTIVAAHIFATILGAFVSGFLMFLLIAYGIPALLML